MNNTVVLQAIGFSSGSNLYHVLYNNSVGLIILACAGSLPGYWTAVFTIDTIGRKPLQVFGFAILTIIFCVMGFSYNSLSESAMLALYVVAQFFFNWGPNTTTFIVPGECFPTRYRSTGHGVSAAMGKVGAIVAQVISIPLLSKDAPPNCTGSTCSPWLNRLMQIFALFMLCGTVVSLLVPETKGVTLEELAGEPPTSYNAGRNGSITQPPGSSSSRQWKRNPFRGGQPAGFVYPRVRLGRGGTKGGWARSPRVGIMTSPELAAQNGSSPRSHGEKKSGGARGKFAKKLGMFGRERGTSTASDEYAFSSTSSTAGRTTGAVADGFTATATPANVLPGWSAGWGRVDRGGHPTSLENIRLQDVGSLLK